MGPQSFPNDVRHRPIFDRRATTEFLVEFAIEPERHLLDVRARRLTLHHASVGPFETSPTALTPRPGTCRQREDSALNLLGRVRFHDHDTNPVGQAARPGRDEESPT